MEKKTIGSFIAALRRANGLTQRQLADKLCVSDKAVSRWERDEALPDLSLIPELADIFGVSADEILRGERQNPESRNSPASSDKGEKLRKRLLAKKKRTFNILSAVSVGICVIGLIAAMFFNFVQWEARTGFFFSIAHFTVSIIMQICATISYLSDLDEDMLTEAEKIQRNTHAYRCAFRSFITTFMLLMLILPLVTHTPNDSIRAIDWLNAGIVFEMFGMIVSMIAYLVLGVGLHKGGKIQLTEKQIKLFKLKSRYVKLFLLILSVLILIHVLTVVVLSRIDVPRVTFHNWTDFKEYLEKPVMRYGANYEITEGNENPLKTIYDETGNELCVFYHNNHAVFGWDYYQKENGTWQIEVADLVKIDRQHTLFQAVLMPVLFLMYPVSAILIYTSYRRKAKKI